MEERTEDKSVPEERPASRRPDSNMIIAIALAIISLCALIVSIYQTKILVAQQELAVQAEKAQLWPRVEASFGGFFSGTQYTEVALTLENVGTGPAIIDEFSLFYKGKPCRSWFELYQRMSGENVLRSGKAQITNMIPTNDVLKAGEKVTIFRLEPDPTDLLPAVMQQFSESGLIEIGFCYRSVFGDRWSVSGDLIDDLVATEGCAGY